LKEVSDFNADDKESLIVIGEVGNSEEEALSIENAIIINRDENQSGHETKLISLSEAIQNISLFEGEIIAVEGKPELKQFMIERIYKPKPIPKADNTFIGNVKIPIKV
jgi:hypothetical protein